MLVLSRRPKERILIGNDITVDVLSIHPDRVSIGITAPKDVIVLRSEIVDSVRDGTSSLTMRQVQDLQSSLALLLNHVRREKVDADGYAELIVAKEFIDEATAALERSRVGMAERDLAESLILESESKVAS